MIQVLRLYLIEMLNVFFSMFEFLGKTKGHHLDKSSLEKFLSLFNMKAALCFFAFRALLIHLYAAAI